MTPSRGSARQSTAGAQRCRDRDPALVAARLTCPSGVCLSVCFTSCVELLRPNVGRDDLNPVSKACQSDRSAWLLCSRQNRSWRVRTMPPGTRSITAMDRAGYGAPASALASADRRRLIADLDVRGDVVLQ